MFKKIHRMELLEGNLILTKTKDGFGRTCPCPFAYPKPCGTWCIHFGDVGHANGDARLDYTLTLECCGTLIFAKEFEEFSSFEEYMNKKAEVKDDRTV